MSDNKSATLEKIISLSKRRGFIFPGSEIYGGLANTYDFGPLGTELKRNLQNYWWDTFVSSRPDVFGLDTAIIMSSKVWEASGHTANFTNVLIDCLTCHFRTRADHLIEDALPDLGNVEDMMRMMVELAMVASNGEAKRLIEQGGVYLNEERVEKGAMDLKVGKGVVRVGKRKYIKIVR